MNALLSRSLGEHKFKEANKIGVNAAFLYFLSYLVFLILGFTVVKPFYASQIKGADAEIMEMGIEYLRTVMIFSFGLLAQIYFERLLTSTGKTLFSMTSQLCGALTNIILDPIMIFGLLGCPAMGVTGAAVATVIGQCVAAVVAFTCNHKFNTEIKIRFQGFRPDIKIIGTIYAIGVPSIIMQSIGSVMTYSMNRILIAFSSTATAVFGVYFKLQSFFFMPVFGLNNGITPIIAFNYGAQNRKRMIKTIKLSLITAFCLTFVGFLSFELIPQVLLGMFNASEDMLAIGIPALRIIGVHSDRLVLYHLRNSISGSRKSSIQHDRIDPSSARGPDPGSLPSFPDRRTACGMVVLPDCRGCISCCFTDFPVQCQPTDYF